MSPQGLEDSRDLVAAYYMAMERAGESQCGVVEDSDVGTSVMVEVDTGLVVVVERDRYLVFGSGSIHLP